MTSRTRFVAAVAGTVVVALCCFTPILVLLLAALGVAVLTIQFDAKGFGLRSPQFYRVAFTLGFRTNDPRYAWLNEALDSVQGRFDERTGRAAWDPYIPSTLLERRGQSNTVPAI